MKKVNWSVFVDVLILLVLLVMLYWDGKPVHAQFAGSSGFVYTPVTSATNTQVKSAAGMLHNIMINGGTLTGVITVVDTSASNCTGGTTIATIAQPQIAGQSYLYDSQTLNGLCITTAAAVNLTVSSR